jgi:hypothetical protein
MRAFAMKWWGVTGSLALCGAALAADDKALAQCAAVDNPSARLACYDAVAGRPSDPASAPASGAPAAVVAPAPSADTFGKLNVAPEKLSARIVGKFNHWEFGTVFQLDNGQTWKCVEERTGVYPNLPENPEVEITKTFFGFKMEIKAIGRSIAVRRVS